MGVQATVTNLVGDGTYGITADTAINEFFFNNTTNVAHLENCLVLFLDAASGGLDGNGNPYVYPGTYTSVDSTIIDPVACRDMVSTHAGMGIGPLEYNALIGDIVTAVSGQLEQSANTPFSITYPDGGDQGHADLNALGGAVLDPAFVASIVTDPDGGATLFHRLGGMDGIRSVITTFDGTVANDTAISGYFLSTIGAGRNPRLEECLVRQVCAASGTVGTQPDGGGSIPWPCNYGNEALGLPFTLQYGYLASGTTTADEILYTDGGVAACRDMVSTHLNVTETLTDGGQMWIDINAFDTLVGDLDTTLTGAGVSTADVNTVNSALGPECTAIVQDGGFGCGG